MRIGIDNISPGEATGRQAPGSMRWLLQALLAEFARQRPQYQFVVFTPDWADPLLDEYPANLLVVKLAGVPRNRALRILYQQTALVSAIERQNLDVFLATATIAPLRIKQPVVLVVQHIQFYLMPESDGRFRSIYLRAMLPLSLRKAARAIIFTESSKRDLIRFTGVSPAKVFVVPHGLRPEIWYAAQQPERLIARNSGLELTKHRPYILYVSATYGYKNHLRLIRAFGQFKRKSHLPHVLLLVGSQVSVPFSSLRSEAEKHGVVDDVIIVGRVENPVELYRCADLSVVPTLYETFGFPILEAMACGCPVVTSNFGSMAELAGEAAILVDPYDEGSIAEGMERVLTDAATRAKLVQQGKQRAAPFTWERSAAQTLRILEEL